MHTHIGFPIRAVSQRCGLSAHVIRIWEKRYTAVKPSRTTSNRRLYSEQDIERLILLKAVTQGGHTISSIAHLSTEDLSAIAAQLPPLRGGMRPLSPSDIREVFEQCLTAVEHHNAGALYDCLVSVAVALGPTATTTQIVIPLLHDVGERWYDGRLRVRHEHLMSAVIRSFLGSMTTAFDVPARAPLLVTATPAGELHEFGALMASLTALAEDWRTIYLGPNLPADEIADAVSRTGASALGLSIVYPDPQGQAASQLTEVRRTLGNETPIIIGGRAAATYSATIAEIRATRIAELERLPEILASIAVPSE